MKGLRKLSSIAILLCAFAYPPLAVEAKDISLSNAPHTQSFDAETSLVTAKDGELLLAGRDYDRERYLRRRYYRRHYYRRHRDRDDRYYRRGRRDRDDRYYGRRNRYYIWRVRDRDRYYNRRRDRDRDDRYYDGRYDRDRYDRYYNGRGYYY